ncbi:acetyl-synthetase-like protein [Diplodia corticola]|uniref:Acetyl-synthetase-like protein n=1 Tax=Diplodia corticola TaxID=236234 RepID=A0A1J9SH96_9PEZI|nr:acetyl-synthetase-like protein [Diplodia corticola]OJD38957.1 acetyl-synthetase-like protein [Diplodia corticola]
MSCDSEVSLPAIPYGRRLIAATLDELARTSPNRTYASIPKSDTDITLGFRDITYAELAAAVDHTAYWLDEHLPPPPSRSPSSSVASLPSTGSKSNGENENGSTTEQEPRQTFTYFGPRDLRYILFLVAAMKTDRRMLNTSTMGSLEAQVYLADAAACRAFFYAKDLGGVVPEYVREIPQKIEGSTTITVPSFEDLFFGSVDRAQKHYPYEKTWDEARGDEIAIYHTSGSSGFPKLVPYTNEMFARVDTWNLLEDVDGMTTSKEYYADKRIWVALPIFHLAGALVSLPCALFFSTIPVFLPSTTLPTPSAFTSLTTHYNNNNATTHHPRLDGIFVPPSLLEDLTLHHHDPSCPTNTPMSTPHPALRPLSTIIFGGAPLSPAAGRALAPLRSLRTCIGSTEGGYWPTLRPDGDGDGDDQTAAQTDLWDHIAPHPRMGAAFERVSGGSGEGEDMYELVVVPGAAGANGEVVFTNFFGAAGTMGGGDGGGGRGGAVVGGVWRTKDLFSPYTGPDAERVMGRAAGVWKYRGRTDDLVVLTGEVKMYAGGLEERVGCHARVRHALVGGYGREVPFLLLEVVEGPEGEGGEDVLEEVWEAVEEANRDVGPRVELRRELTLVATKDKPFARLAKGSVDRRGTFARFEKEVDEMYQRWQG